MDFGLIRDMFPDYVEFLALVYLSTSRNGCRRRDFLGSGCGRVPSKYPTWSSALRILAMEKRWGNDKKTGGPLPKAWYRSTLVINSRNLGFNPK